VHIRLKDRFCGRFVELSLNCTKCMFVIYALVNQGSTPIDTRGECTI
jgi:hypothetical protein